MTEYYDNTRLKAAKECLRHYYFRHKRHWRRVGTAPALAFGASWHSAMDVVWAGANSGHSNETLAKGALAAFATKWEAEGMPRVSTWTLQHEQELAPRTPAIAYEMILEYLKLRRGMLSEIELLAVEKPFAVPLSPDDPSVFYVGRRDKDFKFNGRILTGEHKTTTSYKEGAPFRYDYLESFSPNAQIDGYIHSGHMDFGDAYQGVWVDAALVHKKVHNGFKIIPILRQFEMIESWLTDTQFWIRQIQEQDRLLEKDKNATFMQAFPKNTESCFRCTFKDICKLSPNPEKIVEPPEGFIVEKWSPFDELKLSTLGLKKETENGQ